MNKTVKEIVEECGISIRSYYDETGSTEQEIDQLVQCFVQESIDGLLNAYGPDDCLPQEEIAGFLKEHFGVE